MASCQLKNSFLYEELFGVAKFTKLKGGLKKNEI